MPDSPAPTIRTSRCSGFWSIAVIDHLPEGALPHIVGGTVAAAYCPGQQSPFLTAVRNGTWEGPRGLRSARPLRGRATPASLSPSPRPRHPPPPSPRLRPLHRP